MLKSVIAVAATSVLLAACVAREEPEQPHAASVPAASRPATSQTNLQDAPIPNRRVGRGSDDEFIRFAP